MYNYGVISGQYMSVTFKSDINTNSSGSVKKDFSPPVDLSGMDSFNFYVKVQDRTKIQKIRVRLRHSPSGNWSKCDSPNVNNANGFQNSVWRLVSLPRRSFDNNTDAHWGSVDRISIIIYDDPDGSYTTTVWLDEIGCEFAGPNVVGDNESWGCYKTGHSACLSCHDPGSEHIDGNRAGIFDYIKLEENPTNFRFYNNKQMILPYNCDTVDCESPDPWIGFYQAEAYALCYECHLESNVVKYAIVEDLYGFTNFTDLYHDFGGSAANANLHLVHLKMSPATMNVTCVLCHDPHGQANPAMTRHECGDLFYFDPDGCEIQLGADSDGDGTDDWHDPDVNMGAAQTTPFYNPLCTDVCHHCTYGQNSPGTNPDCPDRSFVDWYYTPCGSWGYHRDYTYIPLAEPGGE
jgi:hypothetical protein